MSDNKFTMSDYFKKQEHGIPLSEQEQSEINNLIKLAVEQSRKDKDTPEQIQADDEMAHELERISKLAIKYNIPYRECLKMIVSGEITIE